MNTALVSQPAGIGPTLQSVGSYSATTCQIQNYCTHFHVLVFSPTWCSKKRLEEFCKKNLNRTTHSCKNYKHLELVMDKLDSSIKTCNLNVKLTENPFTRPNYSIIQSGTESE